MITTERLAARRQLLEQERAKCDQMAASLSAQAVHVRETALRLDGALQLLKDLDAEMSALALASIPATPAAASATDAPG